MGEIICTGNNGNGCFMDSCGHNCGCEGLKEFAENWATKELEKYTFENEFINKQSFKIKPAVIIDDKVVFD